MASGVGGTLQTGADAPRAWLGSRAGLPESSQKTETDAHTYASAAACCVCCGQRTITGRNQGWGLVFCFVFQPVNKFKNVFLSHYRGGEKNQMNGVSPHAIR